MATIPLPAAEFMQIVPLHRFTNADYLELIEKGILGPGDHVELINGLIVDKQDRAVPTHRFSTDQYLEMIDKGVIRPDDRVELVNGIIVDVSPAGARHNQFLGQLNRLLAPLLDRFDIWIQGTLTVAEGQVYDPDLMLLRQKPGGYKLQLPRPDDVLLVVEAADSSYRRDQQIKLPMYATAGIREFWLADLDREELHIYRNPTGGTYQSTLVRHGDDSVSPACAPDLSFAVRLAFE